MNVEMEKHDPYKPSEGHDEVKKEEGTEVEGSMHEDLGDIVLSDREREHLKYRTSHLPEIPKRAIALSIFLLLVGIGFILGGLGCTFSKAGENCFLYLIFGGIIAVPGIYYTFYLYIAYRTQNPDEREAILEEIPM
eukprot:TRINITY_DN2932_c0_g1_i1.p1 TRINITY_DN2932_c0_g1~~TRINITY_DN2932_c0_g1_i1.p1  ORF type:complete len:136 (+),score=38.29 TRINITY_DN2932_c0_g1_i1:66-473(+)